MIKLVSASLIAVILSGSTGTTWARFKSKLYPYSILQPSSFRHIVLSIDDEQRSDYFSPGLGSYTTSVTISATHGPVLNSVRDLPSHGGTHVKSGGNVVVLGRSIPLTRANFHGLAGSWVEEQLTFSAGGYAWRITASYDMRYKGLRSTMVRMMQSFKLHTLQTRR